MDSFRKQQKKKDSKRAKETRDSAREIRDLLNDPSKIDQEIEKVQKQSDENKLDKGLKDRIIELKRMKEVALQKQRIDAAQGKRVNKPEASNQSSTYGSQAVAQRAPGNAQYVQAQQQYGGLYGVPPGYAQPHGAAYPGGVLPQQYYGYSHPGGMMPVAMGGVNGIPLPPPRPPVAAAPGPPSSGAASAQRERKKRQDSDFVDPLDPMASNYTERYGRKPERSSETVVQSHSQVPPAPQRSAPNPPIRNIPQTANNGNREEEEEDDHDGEYDEETQRRLLQLTASYRQQEHHDAGENEIGPALPPTSHKRSRESDDGGEDNDEHAQKRGKTKKVSEDTMVLPGMEFYADDDEDEDDDNSNDGDADDEQHQNRGELAQKDDVSDEEDDDDASAAVGPSMPQGFDGYQYDYSSYSAFPALMDPEEYLRQMQQQNEAGNNESQPQPQPTAVSSSSSSAHGRDVWVEDGDDDDGGDIQPSQAFTAPEPTPSDASLFPTAPSTLSAAPTTAPTSSSSATAAVHKADASLTAFLPSVLKKKIPAKKPGLVPRPPPSLPPPAAAVASASAAPAPAAVAPTSAAPVAEADDEYLRFMAEINELG